MDSRPDIRISKFDASFTRAFAELNYEWIAADYVIEQHDIQILESPQEYVVGNGGEVFFAIVGEEAAGTVALIYVDDETFELAKMAVAPAYRGSGIGNKLMEVCIDHARNSGASRIVLESNTKQAAAIRLYRKFGFIETELDPNSAYERASTFEWNLP